MASISGNTVSLGSGKNMTLLVSYSLTNSGIQFRPSVQITGEAWRRKHAITIKYDNYSKTINSKAGPNAKGAYRWFLWEPFSGYDSRATYSLAVSCTAMGKTSSCTITSNLLPMAPWINFAFNNNNRQIITVGSQGAKGILVNSVTIQKQTDIGTANWEDFATHSINSNTAYQRDYPDEVTERGHRYRYRARANNGNGSSGWVYTGWDYTYPPDVSNVGHVRLSNSACRVSLQREGQAVDRSLITHIAIERSQSGGSWARIATIPAGSPNQSTVTYQDNTCKVNQYYSYRVRPVNPRGESKDAYDERGTDPTYNTPAAPANVKAVFTSANNGQLTFDNPANTADTLHIERSDDGGSTWDEIDTVDESQGVVTSYLDQADISGANVQYRIRNSRSDMAPAEMYSPYAYSNTMSTLKKPSPPTLTIPANGTPVNLDNGFVPLSWVHNPNDGTPQEAAQIQYRINGTYIATITVGAVASYDLTLDPSRFSGNDEVTWRVRTKGAYAEYSDWCEYGAFTILTSPQIKFTAPENGSTIQNLPLPLSWLYNDDSGTLATLRLEIMQGVKTLKSIDIDTGTGESGTYTYSLADFLFDNGENYDLRVTAVSSTGLSSSDTITLIVDYEYVQFQNALFADADFDEDTGVVSLILNKNLATVEGEVITSEVKEAYLYRTVGNNKELVASEIVEGDQIEDKYAPVNVPVIYDLLQVAETGEITVITQQFIFNSNYWYVYYGTDKEEIARAQWDPSGDVSISRPERQQIRYSGREYPVSYDSTAIEETYNFSGVVEAREELDSFIEMIRQGGQGIWKSGDGQCYDADFEFSYSADYTLNHMRWDISLDVTRIE